MKRKRGKQAQATTPEVTPQVKGKRHLADYLYQIAEATGEDVGSREDFSKTLEGWQEKWRQRPLEHWLKYYNNSSSPDDGNRITPT